jgi:hypothetical protein
MARLPSHRAVTRCGMTPGGETSRPEPDGTTLTPMSSGLAAINRALNLIPKRAESRQAERLRDTFVDSGVAAALEAIDDQVLYGRRGTGKTHALRYLETTVGARGDIAVYVDLRTIGSPDGLFAGQTMPPTERAARLLVDLLGQVHDALLAAAIDDEALAAKAALRAAERKVSVPDVRSAARAWFQADKEAALRGREEAQRLLNWIIDKVIKQKRARGFMVNQKATGAPLLRALFDARVLHVVRRGYSAQDEPGERYDVYVIDYGAYVDLIHTKYEPLGVLPFAEDGAYTDVPAEDLRALRRAILDLDEFHASADAPEEGTAMPYDGHGITATSGSLTLPHQNT